MIYIAENGPFAKANYSDFLVLNKDYYQGKIAVKISILVQ
uniref:Uncharacterized protein n=1 Tax=viral metagenome TaxID=1070528 RepID=A0A6C0KJ69_9ZZZZ